MKKLYMYGPKCCSDGCQGCSERVEGENGKASRFASKLECRIYHFLKSECGLKPNEDFVYNKGIGDCPFNKSYNYRTDFYIKKYKLCIEVKGDLTYFEVNKQMWLHDYRKDYNFYLLVLTNEDWINRCPIDGREKDTYIERAIDVQLEELKDFINGSLKLERLVEKSWQRLSQYIKTRGEDLDVWNDRLKYRKQLKPRTENEYRSENKARAIRGKFELVYAAEVCGRRARCSFTVGDGRRNDEPEKRIRSMQEDSDGNGADAFDGDGVGAESVFLS